MGKNRKKLGFGMEFKKNSGGAAGLNDGEKQEQIGMKLGKNCD